MIREIQVAVNYLINKIIFKLTGFVPQTDANDPRPIPPLPPGLCMERLAEFQIALFQTMCNAFRPTWVIGSPVRGQNERAIRLHGERNDSSHECIEQALAACGLDYQELRLHELWMDLIVNPGMVYVIEDGIVFLYDRTRDQLAEELVDEVMADDDTNGGNIE